MIQIDKAKEVLEYILADKKLSADFIYLANLPTKFNFISGAEVSQKGILLDLTDKNVVSKLLWARVLRKANDNSSIVNLAKYTVSWLLSAAFINALNNLFIEQNTPINVEYRDGFKIETHFYSTATWNNGYRYYLHFADDIISKSGNVSYGLLITVSEDDINAIGPNDSVVDITNKKRFKITFSDRRTADEYEIIKEIPLMRLSKNFVIDTLKYAYKKIDSKIN